MGITVYHAIDGVRKGIAHLRDNLRLCEVLGKRALERALQEFNWPRQEEMLLGVYKNLQGLHQRLET